VDKRPVVKRFCCEGHKRDFINQMAEGDDHATAPRSFDVV
jgi:hypothetical protein